MRLAVIGAGFIGRAVAQLALAAGHAVMLSNSRGPQTMSSVRSGIPGVQVGTAQDAASWRLCWWRSR
jgi:Predicted dinucleotide-binding enzymes